MTNLIKHHLQYVGKVKIDILYSDGTRLTLYEHNEGETELSHLFARAVTNSDLSPSLPTYLDALVYTGDPGTALSCLAQDVLLTGRSITKEGDIWYGNFNALISKSDTTTVVNLGNSSIFKVLSPSKEVMAKIDVKELTLGNVIGDNRMLVIRWSMGLVNIEDLERFT